MSYFDCKFSEEDTTNLERIRSSLYPRFIILFQKRHFLKLRPQKLQIIERIKVLI